MSMNDKDLPLAVLEQLFLAPAASGIRISEAIKKAGRIPERNVNEKIRDFVKNYSFEYPDDIYYWSEGQKIYPGKFEDSNGEVHTPPLGTSVKWKLESKPKVLSDEIQALTLALTSRFTRYFLPPAEREIIKSLCEGKIAPDVRQSAWLNQIDIVPRYPPLYPTYNEDSYAYIEKVILRAMKTNTGFKARYLEDSWKSFYPVKLIRREWVSYVLCADDPLDPCYKEYAIHRFQVTKANHPDDVELEELPVNHAIDYLTQEVSSGVEGHWGMLETLILEVRGKPAQHISEMRFHEQPKDAALTKVIEKQPNDGSRLDYVKMEVRQLNYTYEFKTWILGLGRYARVLKATPSDKGSKIDVKKDLKKDIDAMNEFY